MSILKDDRLGARVSLAEGCDSCGDLWGWPMSTVLLAADVFWLRNDDDDYHIALI